MIDARFRPLPTWPYPSTPSDARRSRSTFKASWTSTLNLLDRELSYLDARDIVIECGLRPSDIRVDGWPRANAAEPLHPGVAVHFDTPRLGHLRYATDSCDFWHHNVRSIAFGLQALRAVDRYGITRGGEQYRGFGELPAGSIALGASTMGQQEAAEFIVAHALDLNGREMFDVDDLFEGHLDNAYKRAAMRLHPDQGGDTATFQRLQEARRILEAAQ